MFANRMATDPLLTALAFHRRGEVLCQKNVLKSETKSYDFRTDAVYALRKKAMQAEKRLIVADGVPTTVTFAAVPIAFRVKVSRIDLASIRKVYDAYCSRMGNYCEAKRAKVSAGVGLNTLLEKDLLGAGDGDMKGAIKNLLLATRSFSSVVHYEVPVRKDGCADLLRSLAGEVISWRSEFKAMTRQLDDQVAKAEEFELISRL